MSKDYLKNFDADSLLATQYGHAHQYSGEQKLCLAILSEAVKQYLAHTHMSPRRARNIVESCEEWFFSDDIEWPFSFVNVCYHLHIEPWYLRKGLQKKIALLSAPMSLNFRRTEGRRII